MTPGAGLRVLAVTADRRFLRQVRLVLPLAALCRAGCLAGFRVLCPTDGSLSDHFPLEAFDAVLVQRSVPAWVTDFLHDRGLPYLLDVDDLLLARPSYSIGLPDAAARQRLGRSMRQCAVLSVSNRRLLAALERRLGVPLAHKAAVIPNALPMDPDDVKPATRPQAMVWSSSDRAALRGDAGAVLDAVAAVAARRNLPVFVVGDPGEDLLAGLPTAQPCGNMGYWRHKAFLRELPTALAVAPLETGGDAETLEFIACKSDVKLVEYGGLGHAGVYSLAPPYADTDIRGGRLVANTREAWTEALERQLAEGYRRAPAEAREILAARHSSKVAREAWWPALDRVRLPRPLALAGLLRALGREGPGDAAGSPRPLHHQLADRLYHDWYCRLTPSFLRRRVGGWLENHLLRSRR